MMVNMVLDQSTHAKVN